ncbi:MAG TPA: hypothetical protein VF532_15470 [Candidatus Angelobacter sp.]
MQRTKYLGISMAERSHRRALVACVYIFLAAILVSAGLLHKRNPLPGRNFLGVNLVFGIVYCGISRVAFGALVRQATFPLPVDNPDPWKYISIKKPVRYTGPGDPDERELAVRNRAYYLAFRIMAIYSLALWPVLLIMEMNTHAVSVNLAATLVFPLIVMALTLPQAVVLWTEADVPVENGEPAVAR